MPSNDSLVIDNYDMDGLRGPPGWNQLVDIRGGNPYYIPNPSISTVGLCFISCIVITVWAALSTRRRKSKTSNPISVYFFGWPRSRYWITMALTIVAFSWAIFDDTFRIINPWVEQRLFLAQFVFDIFWDFARTSLLLNIYDLLFHLMHYSPLGQGSLSRLHFWRYTVIRQSICGFLFLSAFVMMCLRVAYLSGEVFLPPTAGDASYIANYNTENAAVVLCFIRDIIYFLAGLEVLVVSSVLLERNTRIEGSGSKAVYVHTLVWITVPLFLAATFTFISTCIRTPPEADIGGIVNPGDDFDFSLAAIQFAATVIGGVGVVLPLAGMSIVTKRVDQMMGKGERLGSESSELMDIILLARNAGETYAYPASLSSDILLPTSPKHKEVPSIEISTVV